MIDRIPLTEASQLDQIDDKECIEGYWSGKDNEPEPGGNRSLSFWHGWRNGMMDGRHMEHDNCSRALAYDIVKTSYFKNKLIQK